MKLSSIFLSCSISIIIVTVALAVPVWRTNPPGQPPTAYQEWTFDDSDNPALPEFVTNSYGIPLATLLVLGKPADADSTSTVVSIITNETGFIWTGYILTLATEGSATFVEGTAGSTKFATALYPDTRRLEFWNGAVLPGKVVTFQFDVSVPDGPPYTYTLTHQPVPEPATFALLGLGALVLVAGRRKTN